MKDEFEEREKYWNRKLEDERRQHKGEITRNEKKMKRLQLKLTNIEKQFLETDRQDKRDKQVGSNERISTGEAKKDKKKGKLCCHHDKYMSNHDCCEFLHESSSSILRGSNSDSPIDTDLVKSVLKEMIKLYELRNFIEDECDYLVCKKHGICTN